MNGCWIIAYSVASNDGGGTCVESTVGYVMLQVDAAFLLEALGRWAVGTETTEAMKGSPKRMETTPASDPEQCGGLG